MSNQEGVEKLMSTIKKLIDKANGTNNLEEADAFMKKAQEMLKKYNLDAERVMSREEVQKQGVEETRVVYDETWQAFLAMYISKANMCRLITIGGFGVSKFAVIGKPSNVAAVVYLYEFYRGAIMGLALKRYDEMVKSFMSDLNLSTKEKNKHKSNFIENYIKGCVDGVNDQMTKQKEVEMCDGEIRGMVLHNEDLVQKYMDANYPNLGRSRSGYTSGSGGGYNSGRSDGQGIGSRTDGGSSRKMIG